MTEQVAVRHNDWVSVLALVMSSINDLGFRTGTIDKLLHFNMFSCLRNHWPLGAAAVRRYEESYLIRYHVSASLDTHPLGEVGK